MKFPTYFLLPISFLALLLTGCAGYQLGETKSASFVGINKIHVPPFKNLTLEPRLSSLVTNAVLKDLQADGTYQIATRKNCDAILVGQIAQVSKSQLRAARNNTLQSEELTLLLTVEFHLEDPRTGARIGELANQEKSGNSSWGDSKTGDSSFIRSRPGLVVGKAIQVIDPNFQIGERNDLSIAAQDLSDKLVSQLVNGW